MVRQDFLAKIVTQQGHDEMRVEPTSRRLGGSGWQPVDVQQRLEPLEREFDLPAQPVGGEHFLGGVSLYRQRGCQDDERGGDQAARIERLLLAAGRTTQRLAGGCGRLWRLAQDDQP